MLNRSLSKEESEEVLTLMDQMKANTEPGILSTMGDLLENPVATLELFNLTLQDKYVTDNAELEKYPEVDR